MDQSVFHSFRLTMQEKKFGIFGVHVYKAGQGTVEHRFRCDDRVIQHSVSKTFTSVGVGIAQQEGLLCLDDTLLSFFPEYEDVAAPGTEEITIKNLLQMSSGKDIFWCEPEDEKEMDAAEIFIRLPLARKVGKTFWYSNYCSYMLGRIIEKRSGQILRNYLDERLFEPLDIFNPQWHTCLRGHTIGATGLYLTTSEISKLGQMLLHKGEYQGKRILNEEYIAKMSGDILDTGGRFLSDSESVNGYGYHVWNCSRPGVYRADGKYGQFVIIFPDEEVVVSINSHHETGDNDMILAVYEDILPLL